MGNEKYPRENDFNDYVDHRDGFSNAHTCGDFTLFYFDVQRNYFREALDRFANFFVAPLLRKDCVDRELEAVDSGKLRSRFFPNLHLSLLFFYLKNLSS